MRAILLKVFAVAAIAAVFCTGCNDGGVTRTPPAPGARTLTVRANPIQGGFVSRYPDKNFYDDGETVAVMATAYDGYTFTGWTTGVASFAANPLTITMDGNWSLTANFQIVDPTQPWCDGTPPQLTLVGGTTTIYTNDGQAELNRLMGRGTNGWTGVVSWTGEGVKMADARLTVGGVTDVAWVPGSMPASGQYIIVYRAYKDMCKGVVPEAVIQRGLVIIEYIASNQEPPIVRLTGQSIVSVDIGQSYIDPGVDAQEAIGPVIQLDSITVKSENGGSVGISTITAATTQAALSQLNTQLTAKNEVAGKYIVTYYASSRINGKSASVSRTVEFKVGSSVGLPVPVIVLNKYTHSFGGKTIEHVDTAFATGGSYREIGIEEVYYMKDGVKTSIPSDRVTRPTVSGSQSFAERTAQYSLPAMPNEYQGATATRYVTIWDGYCDDNTAPDVAWTEGGDALTLSLSNGGEWNYIASWSVRGYDELRTARKYLVDLGGLERLEPNGDKSTTNRAVLKPGTYTITYVGLGGCGGTTVKTRTLTVRP